MGLSEDIENHRISPRTAAQQRELVDKTLERLEKLREDLTLQITIPQAPLMEFFRRLQFTTEELRRVRNGITRRELREVSPATKRLPVNYWSDDRD